MQKKERGLPNLPFVTRKISSALPDIGGIDLERLFQADRRIKRVGPLYQLPRILAIGGGESGVGKTVLSALLGMTLARLGHETVLVDADFAGASLHGHLSPFNAERSLRNYLEGKTEDINDLALPTKQDRLRLITGSPGIASYVQLTFAAKQKLLRNLRQLQSRFVILDLGSGSSFSNVDFFLIADDPVIVSTCESRSLQEAYGFLRVALFRKLQKTSRGWPELYAQFITLGELTLAGPIATVHAFLQEYHRDYPAICSFLENEVAAFRTRLVVNDLHASDDGEKIHTLQLVAKQILGLTVDDWGTIRKDEAVRQALQELNPLMMMAGEAAEDVERVIRSQILIPSAAR